MNVDGASGTWQSLREQVVRARVDCATLAHHEITRMRGLYGIELPQDTLNEDDRILQERSTDVQGLTVVDVLARPMLTYSRILERKLNVYWDSMDAPDHDMATQYSLWLKQWGLLREPPSGLSVHRMDMDAPRRIWHSGADYSRLFKARLVLKLTAGDLIVQNNMTWTHATANWSPNSGIRKVVAAFA